MFFTPSITSSSSNAASSSLLITCACYSSQRKTSLLAEDTPFDPPRSAFADEENNVIDLSEVLKVPEMLTDVRDCAIDKNGNRQLLSNEQLTAVC